MTAMRILVTGAGRGLGAYLARHLAAAGHSVVVHYRSSELEASHLVDEIRRSGGSADLEQADLAQARDAKALAERIGDGERLDGLINNAGELLIKRFDELAADEWDAQIGSNLSAAFHITSALLPQLRHPGGRIINITDAAAGRMSPRPMTLPYSIAKSGMLVFTKTLARQEAEHGLTVNAVAPGILEHSDPLPAVDKIPAGRYGTNEDVAAVVDFLLSDGAEYVTGASIPVSGGWNL